MHYDESSENKVLQSAEETRVEEHNAQETRIALVGVIVQNEESVDQLNAILHEYRSSIIGRMGVPCATKGFSIITVVIDAPVDVISALAGKVGMLKGVLSKTVHLKLES